MKCPCGGEIVEKKNAPIDATPPLDSSDFIIAECGDCKKRYLFAVGMWDELEGENASKA